ncbi:ribose 5-phosphate isomerase B [Candidatus Marinamargulisbacteria bacterium SCGC AG-439-L15]|nr:ribose 5-phosphate isomerase B [Candidatus Marinamargulisbacteria bacterium SCGC AG-439-L15]
MSTYYSISVGSDHGGFPLKSVIVDHLESLGHRVTDEGTHDETSVDYPDFADKVTAAITSNTADLGVLICGTGIGISIKANRQKGIRAALVYNALTAKMAKAHNNANILCLGARTTDPETAKHLVETWLSTEFEGDRHQRRLDKLDS